MKRWINVWEMLKCCGQSIHRKLNEECSLRHTGLSYICMTLPLDIWCTLYSWLGQYFDAFSSKFNRRMPGKQWARLNVMWPFINSLKVSVISNSSTVCVRAKFSCLNIQNSQPEYLGLVSICSEADTTSLYILVGQCQGGAQVCIYSKVPWQQFPGRGDRICSYAYLQLSVMPTRKENPEKVLTVLLDSWKEAAVVYVTHAYPPPFTLARTAPIMTAFSCKMQYFLSIPMED